MDVMLQLKYQNILVNSRVAISGWKSSDIQKNISLHP